MSKLNIVKNVILFSLSDTSLWTGKAKMTAEDLGLTEDEVPPGAIKSMGTKPVIDVDTLKPLRNIKYLMHKECRQVGTKFMSGYAVGMDEAEALVNRLEALIKQGEVVKKAFMATLGANIRSWHDANPQWKHILQAGTPAMEKIERKIAFGYIPTVVSAPENPKIASHFLSAVDAMSNNLVDEIVKDARQFVKQSLKDGRSQGSQKTVDPIRRLVRKIEALKFVEPAIGTLPPILQSVLSTIPTTGQVKADEWLNLCRVATFLSDKDRFTLTAHALHGKTTTSEEVLKDLIGENAVDIMVATAAVTSAAPLEAADQSIAAANLFDQHADDPAAERKAEVDRAVQEITGKQPALTPRVTTVHAPVYDSVDF